MNYPALGPAVRGKIDSIGSMLLYPGPPICPILVRYPSGDGLSKKYRAQCEAIEKDNSLIVVRLRLPDCFAQGCGVTSSFQAGEKRKRHTPADVHTDLIKQPWVEIDDRPSPFEPKKFNLENSEYSKSRQRRRTASESAGDGGSDLKQSPTPTGWDRCNTLVALRVTNSSPVRSIYPVTE